MASDPVHELISSIRTRVEAELNAHAPALAARYEQTVADARQAAAADADRRWSALLDTHKAQAREELQAAVAAAREEAKQGRALLSSLDEIDAARTVSDALTAILSAATTHSSRARLYVGPRFAPWNEEAPETQPPEPLIPSLHEAAATGRIVRHAGDGIVAPLVLDGSSVAVLHAETDSPTTAWVDMIELLARYGGTHLGYLTALRTAQAQQWIAGAGRTGSALTASEPPRLRAAHGASEDDSVQSAKRYARLLVSEIKLYNEEAVREGREHRDLARRLGPEIERARRMYEERVPQSVVDRARHFHHELVQTLAGGDPALLG